MSNTDGEDTQRKKIELAASEHPKYKRLSSFDIANAIMWSDGYIECGIEKQKELASIREQLADSRNEVHELKEYKIKLAKAIDKRMEETDPIFMLAYYDVIKIMNNLSA